SNQKWTAPAPGGGGTPPPGGGPAGRAAAPYLYQWGSPPSATSIMSTTGIRWFTLAFILSNGSCNPAWDGARALTGGSDQSLINSIRGAGGDVIVSFGGWSGNKLGESCTSASALAAAYQRVISAYGLRAIDLDIEATEYSNTTVQQRIVDALKIVRANNPGLVIYITIGTEKTGPDRGLINRAAAGGLAIDGWTIMPFNFGGAGQNMGSLTLQASEGLKSALRSAYGYSDADAYRRMGISSMNGITDNSETVTQADFNTMLGYVQQHQLARFTYWALNRDRPCAGGGDATSSCSGISQQNWDFTRIIAQYQGG
ncbi:chitinase, partial [Micromonospora sp. NPDC049559]|uniref:chitinase n=1 Tax=Micromonospora sp. NPDC049559 TaxID=3155923 RepID=UPI003438811F